MSSVILQKSKAVAEIRLNRVDRLNAINFTLLSELAAAVSEAILDDAVEVVLLAANGRAFCAGDDLVEFETDTADRAQVLRFVEILQGISRQLMMSEKAVVCAAQGWIVGGGAAWPLNADFLVLADDAVMFFPEAKYGLFASGGTSFLLAERCGPERAARLLWFGERLDAAAMMQHGIASQVVPRADLEVAAAELTQALLDLPAVSRVRYKRARIQYIRVALEAALAYEAECCRAAGQDATARRLVAQSPVRHS